MIELTAARLWVILITVSMKRALTVSDFKREVRFHAKSPLAVKVSADSHQMFLPQPGYAHSGPKPSPSRPLG